MRTLISRRTVLERGGLTAGGLVLGLAMPGRGASNPQADVESIDVIGGVGLGEPECLRFFESRRK